VVVEEYSSRKPEVSNVIELKVPDIGGHMHVDVIEVFIKPGDTILQDTSLITLEIDKAMMDIPATTAGLVKEVKVVVGGRVSEGDVIVIVESDSMIRRSTASTSTSTSTSMEMASASSVRSHLGCFSKVNSKASSERGNVDIECDVMVLGGGPGGYSAAFRAADLGLKVVIVERYNTLGGVCLNVGCIPSKALLQNTAAIDVFSHLAENGIKFGKPNVSPEMLRGHTERVIAKLTYGLASLAQARQVTIVHGNGRFIDSHHIEVTMTIEQSLKERGDKEIIHFKKAIIAAGSRILKPPFIPDDPRVMNSTDALKLSCLEAAKRMLIIGGGIIGLEMGTVYSRLGVHLDVVEMMGGLMQGADRDLVRVWQQWNAHRFDRVMLNTKTVSVEPKVSGIWVTFEGDSSPTEPQCYDLVLYATGREPNGRLLGAENAA
jgi:dihydrolipoamide dehydrogenase